MAEEKGFDNKGKVDLFCGSELIKESKLSSMLLFGDVLYNFLIDLIVPVRKQCKCKCLSLKYINLEVPEQVFKYMLALGVEQIWTELDNKLFQFPG